MHDDFLINRLETQKIGISRKVFGERINPKIKTLASTESKHKLISSDGTSSANSRQSNAESNNDDLNSNGINGLNQEAKSTTAKLLPTTNDKIEEPVDGSKNSVEDPNLQSNSGEFKILSIIVIVFRCL